MKQKLLAVLMVAVMAVLFMSASALPPYEKCIPVCRPGRVCITLCSNPVNPLPPRIPPGAILIRHR